MNAHYFLCGFFCFRIMQAFLWAPSTCKNQFIYLHWFVFVRIILNEAWIEWYTNSAYTSTMIHVYSHAIYRVKLFWSIPFLCEVCNQLYICIIVCKYTYCRDFMRIYLVRDTGRIISSFTVPDWIYIQSCTFFSSLGNNRIK